MHVADRGETPNALNLSPEMLERRGDPVVINIGTGEVDPKNYRATEDPKLVALKSGRGPLRPDWLTATGEPKMCAYKVVSVTFDYKGVQKKVELVGLKEYLKIFLVTHRQVHCWMDEWLGLTMDDVHALNTRVFNELNTKPVEMSDSGMIASVDPETANEDDVGEDE